MSLKRGKKEPSVKLVVAPIMKAARYGGKPKYFSDVIVPKRSKISKFTQLRGTTFVYNDEISNSGYNMPRAKLVEIGKTKGFFGKVIRSAVVHDEDLLVCEAGQFDFVMAFLLPPSPRQIDRDPET
jgi:phosphonate transport system substrate-binding protein